MKLRNKKAAIEMSLGTIVTIVLVVAFLVIGIVFLAQIRKGGVEAIDGINNAIQNQINALFADDSTKKVIVIPTSRKIIIKKGDDTLGFGFAIRNVGEEDSLFSYSITADEVSCGIRLSEAEDLIAIGRERTGVNIGRGSIMENPIFVRFNIPETASPCVISYKLDIKKDNQVYGSSIFIEVEIKSA